MGKNVFFANNVMFGRTIFSVTFTCWELVQEALPTCGMTRLTLYLSLRRYWQRGKSHNALLPDFEKCVAKKVTRKPGERKRGRPKKYDGAEWINIDETHQRVILVALKRFCLNESELSLKQAYNSMIRVFYNEGIKAMRFRTIAT